MSSPANNTRPPSSCASRVMPRRSVLFPAPFGAHHTADLTAATDSETSRTTACWRNPPTDRDFHELRSGRASRTRLGSPHLRGLL